MTEKRPMATRAIGEHRSFATEKQMNYIHFLLSILGYQRGQHVNLMRAGAAGAFIGQLTKFIEERIAKDGFIACPKCERPHESLKFLKTCCPPWTNRYNGDLKKTREEARADIIARIKAGEEIAGWTLPQNPVRVLVVGKSTENLQARVIYRGQAPFYFNVRIQQDGE